MARLKWMLVCERTILEETTSVLSIISVIEQIKVTRPPAEVLSRKKPAMVPYRFTTVQYWTRSDPKKPERFPTRVRLIGPNGKSFGMVEQVVDLSTHANARIITQCPGFPLISPGTITSEAQVLKEKTKSWRTVARYKVELQFIDSDQTHPPVPAPAGAT
jgi:hypothetical protein